MVGTRTGDVGMRHPKQNARLQQARGQLFICGMFGNCASSVLSPRTPPAGNSEFPDSQPPLAPAEVLVRHSQTLRHCEDRSTVQIDLPSSRPEPCSPSTSASDGGDTSSTSTDASDACTDLEELLSEIKAGNVTKATIVSFSSKLRSDHNSRALLCSSRVATPLMTLLLSSDLEAEDRELLEESMAALAALAEFDEEAVREMATAEFLGVVMWFVRKGRQGARESASLILEKLSLEENFKGTMGEAVSGVMEALNEMLRDESHLKLVKLATRTMLALCLRYENRSRAVEVGAAASLLEMLPRARSASAEKALATLELLCTTDEGKAAIIEHALAVPVLVELILKVSDRGTEYATGTLSSMCSDSIAMREAAVAQCAPTKLLLLIQSDCTARAKRKASQLLKVLHKIWVEDSCNLDASSTHAIRY